MTDVRDAMGTVRNSVGTVASVVIGAADRARARTLAGNSDLAQAPRRAAGRCGRDFGVVTRRIRKGDCNDKVER